MMKGCYHGLLSILFLAIGGLLLLGNSEKDIHSGGFYDYVIVGSGPGGSSIARILSENPHVSVLLLEAGEDRSKDELIEDSANAWIVPVESVPQYLWQCVQEHNPVVFKKGHRRLDEKEGEGEEKPGDRSTHRRLHGLSEELMEEYTSGRLMGGGTSINGEQYVWPTRRLLESIQEVAGGDPDWSPDHIYEILRDLEEFHGESQAPEERGDDGPLSIISEPEDLEASGMLSYFVDAMRDVRPDIPFVEDYNDPNTPLSTFNRYQLTQNLDGTRASAATALLTEEVRARKNLHIKTRATAMYIKFRGNVAKGVYYTHNGIGKTAFARKKVIIAAGHRSSLLLENSGVGNPEIIGPLLQSVGMKTVADVRGVGENLGNDGYVTINLSRTGSIDENRNNLYVGGAFWPYPGGNSPDGISERFSQIFGADLIDEDSDTFSIFAAVLNVTSRGYAHIQSPDPLYVPLVSADTLQDYHDQQNWLRMMREQIRPIVQAMTNASSDIQLEDEIPWDVVNHSTDISLMDWIIAHYTHAHHWFGTNSMKPYEDGGVVDSSGHVYKTKNLIVADVSIFSIKLDGNTGVPGYITGSVIGRKLAREDKMGGTSHADL